MNVVDPNFNLPSRAELEKRLLEYRKMLHTIDVAHSRLLDLYLYLHKSLNPK